VETGAGTSVAAQADWPAALRTVFAEPWRVRPAFQPIIDLERGGTWGFQVLARFISPVRAAPPEWLAAAEEHGLRDVLEARLAVGIESRAQLQALRTAGIALGQGFGFGRPVPSMAASLTRSTHALLTD
jgi:EAL domain-containing protein (putative c-di-GMP-specific phosphodiesterase class I)